jgi:hypothetical protein
MPLPHKTRIFLALFSLFAGSPWCRILKIWRHSGDTNARRKFTLRLEPLLAAYLQEILVSAEGIEPSTY